MIVSAYTFKCRKTYKRCLPCFINTILSWQFTEVDRLSFMFLSWKLYEPKSGLASIASIAVSLYLKLVQHTTWITCLSEILQHYTVGLRLPCREGSNFIEKDLTTVLLVVICTDKEDGELAMQVSTEITRMETC